MQNIMSLDFHCMLLFMISQTPIEFEKAWHDMLDKYDFGDNQWLNGLYEERYCWVLCFVKITF